MMINIRVSFENGYLNIDNFYKVETKEFKRFVKTF